jgi:hypothetical protein
LLEMKNLDGMDLVSGMLIIMMQLEEDVLSMDVRTQLLTTTMQMQL